MAASIALRSNPTRRLFLIPQTLHLSTHPNRNPNPNPDPQALSRLLSSIKSESDPTRIAELFQSSTHLPRFHAARSLYSFTLKKLARLRRPDLIHRILSSQTSDPNLPTRSEPFLTRILTLYSHHGFPDDALHLFDQMPQRTHLSFSALLSALLRHELYDTVIDKFNLLPSQLTITAGLAAHNVYLRALCAKGEVGAARKVLDEMTAPDIDSYNAVLEGCLMMKRDDVGFDEILEEIARRGLEPNAVTYNCRISMLCARSESFRAEEVLEVMVSRGLLPSLGSFNVLIDGFCKEGDVGSAVRVFKRMRVMKRVNGRDGASPNSETYNMLIRSLVENREFGLGVEICEECLVRKFLPPIEAVKGLIEGLMNNDSVEEAKSVIEKMRTVVKGDAAETWKEVESALAL